MRILALLVLLPFAASAASHADGDMIEKIDDSELSLPDRLRSISWDMYQYHDSLRDDRHDKSTQAQGEEIRKRLQKIIDDAEDEDKKRSSSKSDGSGNKGMKDSRITEYDSTGARIAKVDTIWSRDAREDRADTHLDPTKPIVGGSGLVTGVWEVRIRAYFTSLAQAQAEHERASWATKK